MEHIPDQGEAVQVSPFARLAAEGKIVPAARAGPIPMPTIPGGDCSASDALIAMREEERW
ncbi:hypothetical protein M8C13_19015 [Crossiella sp. SN42]|uniref:hypothetical protein n=1 Tax=Crossiella sp. SN42 TaxID=2944808 RepID=UPI00207C33FF|nr:hypothetical protein [Crossiella sp. SN42]MCO1577849.1 hypothetical protein [Crossiella sp. SN42]